MYSTSVGIHTSCILTHFYALMMQYQRITFEIIKDFKFSKLYHTECFKIKQFLDFRDGMSDLFTRSRMHTTFFFFFNMYSEIRIPFVLNQWATRHFNILNLDMPHYRVYFQNQFDTKYMQFISNSTSCFYEKRKREYQQRPARRPIT